MIRKQSKNNNIEFQMTVSNRDEDDSKLINLETDRLTLVNANPMLRNDIIGFWLLGLMNNTGYVIMLAGAKNIDPSMVGLVYVCNIVPSFTIKLTGPYWFHYVSYKRRMDIASICMALSFILVAIGNTTDNLSLELLGIVFGSAQSGFGEASFLALTAFYDSRKALTAWSSGTGCAGPVGYFWVVLFNIWLDLSFATTLYVGLILPIIYWIAFNLVLSAPIIERDELDNLPSLLDKKLLDKKNDKKNDKINNNNNSFDINASNISIDSVLVNDATVSMTITERFYATLKLWPFMVPLFLVYFAEYTIQSGIWSAYGFPVTDGHARDTFYVYANWLYQFGVLISRSSGMIYKANMFEYWCFPACQIGLLIFFLLDAYYQFWYNESVYVVCFIVGLFGGACYVNGFSLLAEKVDPHMKEFSLSSASIADSLGIVLATSISIFIQQSLYNYHNIHD